jgi:hypothetical protein
MLLCKNERMNRCCSLALSFALMFILFTPVNSLAAADTIVPEGTRICLQLNNHVSTRLNSEGDPFKAIVTEPVYLGDRMVIPKGSEVIGSISRIQRPGRFKGKAALTLLFQSIRIPGHGELPIVASLTGVDREGNRGISTEGTIEGEGSEGRDVGRVLTPGLVGAGIGGLSSGGRGAGIGAGVGVAIGLATVFTSRGKDIEMRRGSTLDISLDKPLSIPPEADGVAARNH